MTRPGPWSVKGVDDDVRRIARAAAAREGLTIGTWIDRAILTQTGIAVADGTSPVSVEPARSLATPAAPAGLSSEDAPAAKAKSSIESLPQDRSPATAPVEPAEERTSLFVYAPRPEDSGRRLPKSTLAAFAVIIVGALGTWGYMTMGPGGSASRTDQAASASNRSNAEAVARPQSTAEQANVVPAASQPGNRLTQLRAIAEKGNARAQFDLGTLYLNGGEVARNPAEAARWFAMAAEQGDADALYSLGQLHESGDGVPKDQQKAAVLYGRALAAGSAKAAAKITPVQSALQTAPSSPAETAGAVAVTPAAGETGGTATSASGDDRQLSAGEIADIQRLLGRLDIAPGESDGVLGKRTVDAIMMYQRFAGLPIDGRPTATLLNDLRQVVGAMDSGRATGK